MKDEAYMNLLKDHQELKKENKILKEKLSEITMVADDEKQSIEHILELEEENKKLKEEVKELRRNGEYYHRDNCQLRDEIMKCKEVNGELNEENEDLKKRLQEWLDYINRHNY